MMPKPMCTSPFSMKAGMMVWYGRLRGGERVRVRGIEFEQPAAILQREAVIVHHHARPEVLVDALNQGCDVAVAIDHGEIDGIAGHGLRAAGRFLAARVRRHRSAWRARAHRPAKSGLRRAPWPCADRPGSDADRRRPASALRSGRATPRRRGARSCPAGIGRECSAFRAGPCPGRWAAARRPSSRDSRWRWAAPIHWKIRSSRRPPCCRRGARWF